MGTGIRGVGGRQAVEKGIRALLHHKAALQEAADVDSLRTADGGTVGQGTRDKIKQIVALGYLPRNKELQSNEEHQCVQLVACPPRPPAPFPSLPPFVHVVAGSALPTAECKLLCSSSSFLTPYHTRVRTLNTANIVMIDTSKFFKIQFEKGQLQRDAKVMARSS